MNLIPVNDMSVMADSIVKSNFYGFKTKEQVMAVMLVAQAEGKHPATVVQEYDIIQGRPALKSQAMLARFQLAGGKVEWHEVSKNKCSGTFSHPAGGSLRVEWTIEMAKAAGLVRDGSGWSKYPEDMLRSRVVSRAVRSVYPACILGHYAVEEVQDFEPSRQVRDMGKVEVVQEEEFIKSDELPPAGVDIWPLNVPGRDTMQCAGKEEWVEAFLMLVGKVANAKLTDAEKQAKVAQLRSANNTAFGRMGIQASAAIYRQITELLPPPEVGAENAKKWVEEFDKALPEPSAPQS
jgi:hypothetical protein